MAKATPTPAPARRIMPAKGGTSVRQATPGEFRPAPAEQPAQPVEEEK